METRLRSKRKQSEEEAAALQAQILTRNTAKKARASGIPAPLFHEQKDTESPAANKRSQHQKQGDTPEGNEVPQARRRGSPRPKAPTRQQSAGKNTSVKGKQARSAAAEEAGPSNAQQRQAERASKEEVTEAEDEMERQMRGESDDGHGREGADDEVCQSLGAQLTSWVSMQALISRGLWQCLLLLDQFLLAGIDKQKAPAKFSMHPTEPFRAPADRSIVPLQRTRGVCI